MCIVMFVKNTDLITNKTNLQTSGGATLIFDTELIAVNGKPTVGKEEDEDDTSGDDEL